MRASYLPRDQASGPAFTLNDHDAAADRIAARRARNRRHAFISVGLLAFLIIAQLVLRSFGVF